MVPSLELRVEDVTARGRSKLGMDTISEPSPGCLLYLSDFECNEVGWLCAIGWYDSWRPHRFSPGLSIADFGLHVFHPWTHHCCYQVHPSCRWLSSYLFYHFPPAFRDLILSLPYPKYEKLSLVIYA